MGMDAYIFKAKTKKAFKEPNWYEDENPNVTEVWYSRKFWDLVQGVSFIKNIEKDACEYIQLRKIDIEEMIDIATHTPDYFGGFESVPKLCEILYNFDEDEANGWHYYFNFDY